MTTFLTWLLLTVWVLVASGLVALVAVWLGRSLVRRFS